MAQTAVDWLVQELKSKGHALITSEGIFINVPNELIEQAKQMEKEQIENAHGKKINGGFRNNGDFFWEEITGEQYYNETFGV
jgi:hypothetical protein